MSPLSAIERTELCTIATMSAAARGGNLEYVVVRSGLEVYGPLTLRGVGSRRRRDARAPHAVRAVAARGRVDRRRACGCATACPCARCATRRLSVRTSRARSAGCCGCRWSRCLRSRIRRSRCCTPTTRPRRWSPRSTADTTARSTSSARRGHAVAGGAPRRPRAVAGGRTVLGRRGARRRARGRGDRAARDRAAPPRPHRRGRPRGRRARPSRTSCPPRRCCASCSSGPT